MQVMANGKKKYEKLKNVDGNDYKFDARVAIGSHDMQIAYRYAIYNSPVVCHVIHDLFKYNELEDLYDYDVGKSH